MKAVHNVTGKARDSIWIANNLKPNWSNILVFDGKVIRAFDSYVKKLKANHSFSEKEIKWMHKKVWLCGIDYETGDLPHYDLADEETRIDLILYFKNLKKIGYNMRILVCDGNPDMPHAAKKVYGEDNLIIQLCTRHFVEGLKRVAGVDKNIPHTQKLINLIQYIIQAKSERQAKYFLKFLNKMRIQTETEKQIIDRFKKHKEDLMAHIKYPELNIPHTSNDIENLFRQLNLRLKTINRFNHWKYARDYLKAWALMRRFTKFTDCRNHRKYRNGKAPLELAGIDITGMDYLKL